MKKRSECDCICHKEGMVAMHFIPCCMPDNSAMESKEEYYKLHSVCPKCGGDPGETTTMGWIFPSRDTNTTCCTACDWKGIVHDLVQKNEW